MHALTLTPTPTYFPLTNTLHYFTTLPFDAWLFTNLVLLPLTPLVGNLLTDRIAAELERTSLSTVEYTEPRYLFPALTLWTYITTLVVTLHLFAPFDYLNTASVTVASWLSLATVIVLTLLLGLFLVVLPTLLHYLYATTPATTQPYTYAVHPTTHLRVTTLDLWFFLLVPSTLYSTLNVLYKLIYFALRLWLLMTLHVFVATTLTLLIAKTMFTAWVTFLLYTPLSCSGYGGFILFVFMYVFGNALYLALQFLVYLGYKLDAFLDAQNLDHLLFTTQLTTLLTLALTCCTIGTIAILLAPLLPHLFQPTTTTPWTTDWRTTLQTYECGNPTLTPLTPVDTHPPPPFSYWFLLLDTFTLLALLYTLPPLSIPTPVITLPLCFVATYALLHL